MSDVPEGPGWWQASDGKWYAPELHPNYLPAPPAPAQPGFVRPPLVASAGLPARRTLSKGQWTQVVALAFGFVGLLMSWGTVLFVSVSGLDTDDGKLFGALLILAALCLFWRVSGSSVVSAVLLLVAWITLVALGIYEIGHISSSQVVSVGTGLYIDTAAVVVGAVFSVVDLLTNSKKRRVQGVYGHHAS